MFLWATHGVLSHRCSGSIVAGINLIYRTVSTDDSCGVDELAKCFSTFVYDDGSRAITEYVEPRTYREVSTVTHPLHSYDVAALLHYQQSCCTTTRYYYYYYGTVS